MKKRQYKTGESQRRAAQAYKDRHNMKNFCITVSELQYNADKELLIAHGLTPGKFWRWAIDKLRDDPTE